MPAPTIPSRNNFDLRSAEYIELQQMAYIVGRMNGVVPTIPSINDFDERNLEYIEDLMWQAMGNGLPLFRGLNNANASPLVDGAYRILIPSGANSDILITPDMDVRMYDFEIIMLGAGVVGAAVNILNGASTWSGAEDVSAKSDGDVVRATNLAHGEADVLSGGAIHVTSASTGANFPGAEVIIKVLRT